MDPVSIDAATRTEFPADAAPELAISSEASGPSSGSMAARIAAVSTLVFILLLVGNEIAFLTLAADTLLEALLPAAPQIVWPLRLALALSALLLAAGIARSVRRGLVPQ